LNTPPQVDSLPQRLAGPLLYGGKISGPLWSSDSVAGYIVENVNRRVPRPLNSRLSHDHRVALVASFASGARQRDLAIQYGISIRSVKRLIRLAREQGIVKQRPQTI
jgi:hypothetical protein